MSQTLNHVKVGVHNRLLILNQIRLHSGTTRAELARYCGLTAATVSNVVEKLLQMGYVLEKPMSKASLRSNSPKVLGRPSLPLEINAQRLYTVGLSCDLQYLQGCIANLKGDVVAFQQQDLPRRQEQPSPEDYISALDQLYRDLIAQADLACAPDTVGLAAMGPLDIANGKIYQHSSNPQWQHCNFVAELQRKIGVPVILEKNFTAAALYEVWNGRGRELDSILYIYLGHGVGGALILKNEIFRGSFANAGEVGHLNVVPDRGKPCLCGRKGCLENYLSLDALEQDLPFPIELNDAELERLFTDKEPHFIAWLKNAAELLSRAVGNSINLLDLNAVILTGLYPESILNFLREFLTQNIAKHIMKGKVGKVEFLLSRREHQPSLGAALLPICESLSSGLIKSDDHTKIFCA